MYIQQAYKGLNDWWRYLVTIILVLAAQFLGSIPLGVIVAIKGVSHGEISEFQSSYNAEVLGISQNVGLIIMLTPMVLTFFVLILAMRYLHGHSLKNVFTSSRQFRWKNFFYAFIFWGVLLTVADLINYRLEPDNYIYSFDPQKFYPLLIIALLLIPLQASAEELYFRGNLFQGIGLLFRSRIVALVLTSAAFGLMHFGNPEVKEFGFGISMAYYIGFGLLMGILVLLDGGLEMPLAIHAVNNIYGAAFVGYSGSVLQTPTLFKLKVYDSVTMLILFIGASAIFLLLSAKLFKWNTFSDRIKSEN